MNFYINWISKDHPISCIAVGFSCLWGKSPVLISADFLVTSCSRIRMLNFRDEDSNCLQLCLCLCTPKWGWLVSQTWKMLQVGAGVFWWRAESLSRRNSCSSRGFMALLHCLSSYAPTSLTKHSEPCQGAVLPTLSASSWTQIKTSNINVVPLVVLFCLFISLF